MKQSAARKGSQPTPQGHRRHASRATQKSVQGRCLTPAGEIANPSREEHPSQQGRLLYESPAHLPQAKGAHLMSSGGRNRWARRLRRLGGLGDLDLHAQGCWRQAKNAKISAKSAKNSEKVESVNKRTPLEKSKYAYPLIIFRRGVCRLGLYFRGIYYLSYVSLTSYCSYEAKS